MFFLESRQVCKVVFINLYEILSPNAVQASGLLFDDNDYCLLAIYMYISYCWMHIKKEEAFVYMFSVNGTHRY